MVSWDSIVWQVYALLLASLLYTVGWIHIPWVMFVFWFVAVLWDYRMPVDHPILRERAHLCFALGYLFGFWFFVAMQQTSSPSAIWTMPLIGLAFALLFEAELICSTWLFRPIIRHQA